MAIYFSKFPKTYYSFSDKQPQTYITNILARWSFERSLKDNPDSYNAAYYYKRLIEDGDTPEILAYKIYGSAEYHWIILMYNDIVDPQWEWPMPYWTFKEYIKNKYGSTEAAQIGVQSYLKVKTTELLYAVQEEITAKNRYMVEKVYIDKDTYDSYTGEIQDPITLPDGSIIQTTITTEALSYYDYEVELNEKKRDIKVLKPEFVSAVTKSLETIFV